MDHQQGSIAFLVNCTHGLKDTVTPIFPLTFHTTTLKRCKDYLGWRGCGQISRPSFYPQLIGALPEIQLVPRRQKSMHVHPQILKYQEQCWT